MTTWSSGPRQNLSKSRNSAMLASLVSASLGSSFSSTVTHADGYPNSDCSGAHAGPFPARRRHPDQRATVRQVLGPGVGVS